MYQKDLLKLEEEGSVNNEITKEIQERSIMNMNTACRWYRMNRCSLSYHNNKEKEQLDRKKMYNAGESDRNTKEQVNKEKEWLDKEKMFESSKR